MPRLNYWTRGNQGRWHRNLSRQFASFLSCSSIPMLLWLIKYVITVVMSSWMLPPLDILQRGVFRWSFTRKSQRSVGQLTNNCHANLGEISRSIAHTHSVPGIQRPPESSDTKQTKEIPQMFVKCVQSSRFFSSSSSERLWYVLSGLGKDMHCSQNKSQDDSRSSRQDKFSGKCDFDGFSKVRTGNTSIFVCFVSLDSGGRWISSLHI